jgi:hypothetical protein
MLQVFHPILAKDEDVIQKYHKKIVIEGPQYIIHQSHEICWSICQTKGHE